MTTTETTGAPAHLETTQVHKIYIKAPAQKIFDALTTEEWSQQYGYGGFVNYDLRVGGALATRPSQEMIDGTRAMGGELPEIIIDGEILELDAPFHLKTTWRMMMDPEMAAEGFSVLTYDIKELDGGYCSLTVTHELAGQPKLALVVSGSQEEFGAGGGHPWILSDLKSLLETGSTMVTW
jgi:uncharacterized protein YndB with AHSA1/START domain